MARGGLDYEGIGFRAATYAANAALQAVVLASGVASVEGKAVTITGNNEAGFGSAGDALLGKIVKYENDHYMTIQDAGYAEMPGVSDALPTAGNALVVNGAGLVSATATAKTAARAVVVDSSDNTVMVLIG